MIDLRGNANKEMQLEISDLQLDDLMRQKRARQREKEREFQSIPTGISEHPVILTLYLPKNFEFDGY